MTAAAAEPRSRLVLLTSWTMLQMLCSHVPAPAVISGSCGAGTAARTAVA